jgi:hypothetical protein
MFEGQLTLFIRFSGIEREIFLKCFGANDFISPFQYKNSSYQVDGAQQHC